MGMMASWPAREAGVRTVKKFSATAAVFAAFAIGFGLAVLVNPLI
jgi:hypothetical protein